MTKISSSGQNGCFGRWTLWHFIPLVPPSPNPGLCRLHPQFPNMKLATLVRVERKPPPPHLSAVAICLHFPLMFLFFRSSLPTLPLHSSTPSSLSSPTASGSDCGTVGDIISWATIWLRLSQVGISLAQNQKATRQSHSCYWPLPSQAIGICHKTILFTKFSDNKASGSTLGGRTARLRFIVCKTPTGHQQRLIPTTPFECTTF